MFASKRASTDGGHEWADPDAPSSAQLRPEGAGAEDGAKGGRFPRTSPCNDWVWIIFWAAQLVCVVALGFAAFVRHREEMTHPAEAATQMPSARTPPALDAASFAVVGATIGASVGVALAYLALVRRWPTELVWASLLGMLLWIVAGLAICAHQRNWGGTAVFALCVPLHIWFVYSVQDSIPFAVACLRTAMRSLDQWVPSVFAVALAGLLLQAAWFVLSMVGAVAILYGMNVEFERGRPASTSNTDPNAQVINVRLVFALFGLLLSFFWTAQVIKNVVHTTMSGVVATWYFLYPDAMPRNGDGTPASPVWSSLRRACTWSFGSVVLASLVVAVVKALRATFHLVSRWLMDSDTNCCTVAAVCLVDCVLRLIESIVEYVNQYALSYVAVRGGPFWDSARRAFQLMQRRGLDAVVNDSLTGTVLFIGVLVGAAAGAGFAALLAWALKATGALAMWALIGALLGLVVAGGAASVVESAVITLFVCLADDPAALRRTKPDVYDDLVPAMRAEFQDVDLDNIAAADADCERPEGHRNRV